jgi:hypothetical protein
MTSAKKLRCHMYTFSVWNCVAAAALICIVLYLYIMCIIHVLYGRRYTYCNVMEMHEACMLITVTTAHIFKNKKKRICACTLYSAITNTCRTKMFAYTQGANLQIIITHMATYVIGLMHFFLVRDTRCAYYSFNALMDGFYVVTQAPIKLISLCVPWKKYCIYKCTRMRYVGRNPYLLYAISLWGKQNPFYYYFYCFPLFVAQYILRYILILYQTNY